MGTLNSLIGNYEIEGLHRLIRLGLKTSYNLLVKEYEKILEKVKGAATSGWVSTKPIEVNLMATACLGLFSRQ